MQASSRGFKNEQIMLLNKWLAGKTIGAICLQAFYFVKPWHTNLASFLHFQLLGTSDFLQRASKVSSEASYRREISENSLDCDHLGEY